MLLSPSTKNLLSEAVLSFRQPEDVIRRRLVEIQQELLAQSRHVRQADFTAIHPRDLELLFSAYNARFLGGLCRRALEGRPLTFRLAPRMTRVGGKTTRLTTRSGEVSFEIAVAVGMLF